MPTLPFSGIRSRLCDQKKWKFFFFWYGQSTEYFIYSTLYIERENNTTGLTIFPAIFLYLFFCIFFLMIVSIFFWKWINHLLLIERHTKRWPWSQIKNAIFLKGIPVEN